MLICALLIHYRQMNHIPLVRGGIFHDTFPLGIPTQLTFTVPRGDWQRWVHLARFYIRVDS